MEGSCGQGSDLKVLQKLGRRARDVSEAAAAAAV
jgi:hypothetical protein